MKRRFRVMPAVDIKEGKCVTLVGGDPSKRISELEDPLLQARRWERCGSSILHVIDLDGALGGLPANLDLVKDIARKLDIPVQFGGGIRSLEAAEKILNSGIWRIILGTLALHEPSVIGDLSSRFDPERIMVALDFKEDRVLTHGWKSRSDIDPFTAAQRFEKLGAGSVLFTNVEVEGRMKGLPMKPIRKMVRSVDMEVIASGGVSSIEDIISIKRAGAQGAVVGAAIYTERINLREAIDRAER